MSYTLNKLCTRDLTCCLCRLGTGHDVTQTDEFSEKIQMALDTPLPHFWEIKLHFFVKFHAQKALFKSPKSATQIFGLKMTPPPFETFPKIHLFCQGRPSLKIDPTSFFKLF